jgi:hypothetical protein
VRNFDDYRDLGYEPGLATASVFAETGGITRDDILGALPHPQYALASAGELRSHFPLLAASDDDPDLPAELARLQPAHFDVVLVAPPHPAMPATAVAEASPEEVTRLHAALADPAEALTAIFHPRYRKSTRGRG